VQTHRFTALAALWLACVVAGGAGSGQTTAPDPAVTGVVTSALAAAQAGNIAVLQRQYLPDCTFIDEFAPFVWTGPGAQGAYFASGARMAGATGTSNVEITFTAPKYTYVAGPAAYLVVPLTVTSKVRGKLYQATGSLAFTLRKTRSGWKIASQTWAKATETFSPY
jgi:ketosteroid isomerase-like protein